MNILETVLSANDHWRPEGVDFSASEISNSSAYQLWHRMNGTKEIDIPLDLDTVVSSRIGTGFHLLAEQILNDLGDENIKTEVEMQGEIAGYKISGTSDVVYYDEKCDWYTIGDFKTKGNYQMKKAILGDNLQEKIQLSIYAYLYSHMKNVDMNIMGELYLVRTGDKGYFTKREMMIHNIPEENKTIPNRLTKKIDLYDKDEIERFVMQKIERAKKATVDCESWRCDWCRYDCKFRDNIPNPVDSF